MLRRARYYSDIPSKSPSSIEGDLRLHLLKVYSTLIVSILFAAVGVIVEPQIQIAGFLTVITLIFGTISLIFVRDDKLSVPILFSLNFLTGTILSNFVHEFQDVAISGLLLTSLLFISFSVAALTMTEFTAFVFSSVLLNSVFLLIGLQIYNLFYPSELSFLAYFYVSLLVYCCFVAYDTSKIIEKFQFGDRNVVLHSLLLFYDFIDIFLRVVIVLGSKKKK